MENKYASWINISEDLVSIKGMGDSRKWPEACSVHPQKELEIFSRGNDSGRYFSKDLKDFPKSAGHHFREMNLSELFHQISFLSEPLLFKEAMLRSMQLYFDGLVEWPNRNLSEPLAKKVWSDQSEALQALLNGVRKSVAGFYRQGSISFEDVRNTVMPYTSTFLKYGSKAVAKDRRLDGATTQKMNDFTQDVIKGLDGKCVDLIIPIASGGFEPGVLMADCLTVNNLLPIRCSRLGKQDGLALVPAGAPSGYAEQQISEKRVLLVEDIVATGLSLEQCLELVCRHGPKEVYLATVDGWRAPGLAGYRKISRNLRNLR